MIHNFLKYLSFPYRHLVYLFQCSQVVTPLCFKPHLWQSHSQVTHTSITSPPHSSQMYISKAKKKAKWQGKRKEKKKEKERNRRSEKKENKLEEYLLFSTPPSILPSIIIHIIWELNYHKWYHLCFWKSILFTHMFAFNHIISLDIVFKFSFNHLKRLIQR